MTVLPLQFGMVARDRAAVAARLRELGVADPAIEVERRTSLPRTASGSCSS